jgi:LysR family transcriptional regulator, cyn operon transcriptional activator
VELRQLRYFMAVAEASHFTKGAEKVAVSQPSLSVQIAALEQELGTPLFDRLGRKVLLTEAGRMLHAHAERIMRELEMASQSIRELAGGEQGRLTVGALSTVNTYIVPPLVCRFKERFPRVHLQIHTQPSALIEEALLASRVEVGICLLPITDHRLIASRLFMETLCLVGPAATRMPTRLRMRELAGLPLVLLPSDYCLRKMIEAECAAAGIRPEVSVEMTSPEGILEAVRQGAGYTILPELYVRYRLRDVGLRLIRLYDPVPRHTVGIVYRANHHLGKAAQEFVRLCRVTIQELRVGRDPRAADDSARVPADDEAS